MRELNTGVMKEENRRVGMEMTDQGIVVTLDGEAVWTYDSPEEAGEMFWEMRTQVAAGQHPKKEA
jgi:hypothetical protein